MPSGGIEDESTRLGGAYYCFICCGISQLVNKEVMVVLDMGYKVAPLFSKASKTLTYFDQ